MICNWSAPPPKVKLLAKYSLSSYLILLHVSYLLIIYNTADLYTDWIIYTNFYLSMIYNMRVSITPYIVVIIYLIILKYILDYVVCNMHSSVGAFDALRSQLSKPSIKYLNVMLYIGLVEGFTQQSVSSRKLSFTRSSTRYVYIAVYELFIIF